MEKIWILILFLSGCIPASAQEKCFDIKTQRQLLNELDKGRTCDTLLKNREQKIDSLNLKIEKLNLAVEVKKDQVRIQNQTILNYQESVEVLEQEKVTAEKQARKEQRRKIVYKATTLLFLISTGVFIVI